MPSGIDVLRAIETGIRLAGALAGLGTLALALWGFWAAQGRPAGRETGVARVVLRRPTLLVATLLFLAAGVVLWQPLPWELGPALRAAVLIPGALSYFSGLALYLWGRRTLGQMFDAASGFGVRLQVEHRLVTTGPYAWVRHPMYLAVILSGFGGALIYRTWAMAFFAAIMLGLVVRARREEEALAQEFGAEWAAYAERVPAWVPRRRQRS